MKLLFLRCLLLGISILISNITSAQLCKQNGIPKKAEKFYLDAQTFAKTTQYQEAFDALEKAIKAFPTYVDANMMLGQLKETKDLKAAITHYETAVTTLPDCSPMMYVILGSALYRNGEYANGLAAFEQYATYNFNSVKYNKIAEHGKAACKYAIEAIKKPVPFDPQNLGDLVNSSFDDYFPSLSVDEQKLIFARTLTTIGEKENTNEDIYISNKTGELWNTAYNIGPPVNTDYNEGAQTVSPDGKFIFFTRCNAPDGLGKCDIYVTIYENNKWSKPLNLGASVNSPAWESQPCMASDGKTLYFTSNRRGTLGGADIFETIYDGVGWSQPRNLGPTINTAYEEKSPFIHPDGTTLYFNSDGHPGFGDLDFFMSRKKTDTTWQTPINLGYPINTKDEERSIFVNAKGNTAYISSSRAGGLGLQDIYAFELYAGAQPRTVTYIKGRVLDEKTSKPLSAQLVLKDLTTGLVVASTQSDPTTGAFLTALPVGSNYAYMIDKKGYLFASEHFELSVPSDSDEPYLLDVLLKPVSIGESVVLKNIFFKTNSFDLLNESKQELDQLVTLLKTNATLKIEISGHTDDVGKDDANLLLSDNRSKSVVTYLTNSGIDAARLTAKGYGETQPIAENLNDEGRSKNRRTEFKVIAK